MLGNTQYHYKNTITHSHRYAIVSAHVKHTYTDQFSEVFAWFLWLLQIMCFIMRTIDLRFTYPHWAVCSGWWGGVSMTPENERSTYPHWEVCSGRWGATGSPQRGVDVRRGRQQARQGSPVDLPQGSATPSRYSPPNHSQWHHHGVGTTGWWAQQPCVPPPGAHLVLFARSASTHKTHINFSSEK